MLLLRHNIPGLRNICGLSKLALRGQKYFGKAVDNDVAQVDVACLKNAGKTEADVRALLASYGFSQAEVDAAVAASWPPAP